MSGRQARYERRRGGKEGGEGRDVVESTSYGKEKEETQRREKEEEEEEE